MGESKNMTFGKEKNAFPCQDKTQEVPANILVIIVIMLPWQNPVAWNGTKI